MSKPISISFGKPKAKLSAPSSKSLAPARKSAFHEAEDDDEQPPEHESVVGFSTKGAILQTPVEQKREKVIENKGNANWRTRGRPPPDSAKDTSTATSNGLVERHPVSQKAGIQLADASPTSKKHFEDPIPKAAIQTADEAALSALVNPQPAVSHLTIATTTPPTSLRNRGQNETLEFRLDVASRPESSSIAEYAEMPVEEFGMALVRGMGKKRRANGEIIEIKNPNIEDTDAKKKATGGRDPNAGYLGIGAKAVKISGAGGNEDGLGAWGKADMRRNQRGEGLYTPVMLKDKRTGEVITEQELEARKKAATEKTGKKEDWRDKRDKRERNLDSGRDDRNGRDSRPKERKMIEGGSSRRSPRSSSPHNGHQRDRDRDRYRDGDRDRDRHSRLDKPRDRHRDHERDRYRDKNDKHRSRDEDIRSPRNRDSDREGSRRRHK